MSHQPAPHYSHIVHDINSRGGITMYFAKRGQQGDAWERHFERVLPPGGVLLHELHMVDTDESHPAVPAHAALNAAAANRGARVLPAGFYGSSSDESVPTFHPDELLLLMPKSKHHITEQTIQKYQALQRIRELRAGVGSLAWLAAHTDQDGYKGKPIVLWGRTHSSSLPSVYERMGIQSVEVVELDSPHRYSYLQPHGNTWGEDEIQTVFAHSYRHAQNALTN